MAFARPGVNSELNAPLTITSLQEPPAQASPLSLDLRSLKGQSAYLLGQPRRSPQVPPASYDLPRDCLHKRWEALLRETEVAAVALSYVHLEPYVVPVSCVDQFLCRRDERHLLDREDISLVSVP